MKRILHIILLFIPVTTWAQNWQNICSPGVTLYQNITGEIQAFRLDSIQLPGNGDTIFYSYRTIRERQPCADTSNGSVLGFKVYKTESGWFYFFNKSWDTLRINTNTSLDNSWRFCEIPDTGYIDARITEIQSDTTLGMPDSVKVISFQAFDSLGNSIAYPLNGEQFRLSKSYGLSAVADVYQLPWIFESFSLAGISSSVLGIPNLDFRVVFNFDIGDEFHSRGRHRYGYGPGSYSDYFREMKTVLEKTTYGSVDSVTYIYERCLVKATYPHSSPPSIICIHDTVSVTYNFTTPVNNPVSLGLPGEFLPISDGQLYRSTESISRGTNGPYGRQKQLTVPSGFIANPNSSDCWSGPYVWPYKTYGQGIGLMAYKALNLVYGDWDFDSLAYFKKVDEIWGTPLASDCSELLSVELRPSVYELRISIFPNPAKERITLQIENFQPGNTLKFLLFDFLGREIFQTSIRRSPYLLNLSGISGKSSLPAGLYIWQLTGDSGTATGKLILE